MKHPTLSKSHAASFSIVLFCALFFQTAIAGAPSKKIKRLSCKTPNAQAVLVVGATDGDLTDESEASSLTEDLIEISTFCVVTNAEKKLLGLELINGENPKLDRFLSVESFRKNKFQVTRSFPIYGTVLISELACPSCDSEGTEFSFQFKVLHQFHLLGQSQSDYRETNLTMRLNPEGRYEIVHRGKPVHVSLFEAGTLGLNRTRLSECTTSLEGCLKSPEGKIRTIRVLELERERRVKY